VTTDPVSDDTAIRSLEVTRLPTANVVFATELLPSGACAYALPPFPAPTYVPSFLDSDDDLRQPPARTTSTSAEPSTPIPVSPGFSAPARDSPEPSTKTPGASGSPAPAPTEPPTAAPTTPGFSALAPPEPAPAAPISPAPASPAPVSPTPTPVGSALDAREAPGVEATEVEAAAESSASPAQGMRRAEAGEWRGIVVVTGTDTGVGKTIVTAAIAAAALASGLRVAVIKPGQTGIATGAPTDIEVINRLAGPDTARALAEYPEPMAPLAAATIAELPPLELYEVVDAIRTEADKHDLVLVEGAGGLLVPMGVRPSGAPWTVADLATTLGVGTLVVARAGLGTLNHTALTLEALGRRGVPAGVIIGAWPADPQLVHWANLSELVPHLVGALPEGAGQMDPGVFRRSAPGWLTPALYGVLDNWRVWAEDAG